MCFLARHRHFAAGLAPCAVCGLRRRGGGGGSNEVAAQVGRVAAAGTGAARETRGAEGRCPGRQVTVTLAGTRWLVWVLLGQEVS